MDVVEHHLASLEVSLTHLLCSSKVETRDAIAISTDGRGCTRGLVNLLVIVMVMLRIISTLLSYQS
jgi:hypothetical protein